MTAPLFLPCRLWPPRDRLIRGMSAAHAARAFCAFTFPDLPFTDAAGAFVPGDRFDRYLALSAEMLVSRRPLERTFRR